MLRRSSSRSCLRVEKGAVGSGPATTESAEFAQTEAKRSRNRVVSLLRARFRSDPLASAFDRHRAAGSQAVDTVPLHAYNRAA
jgi:hypothetical protein